MILPGLISMAALYIAVKVLLRDPDRAANIADRLCTVIWELGKENG